VTHSLKFSEQVNWHIKPVSTSLPELFPWHIKLIEAVSGFSGFILKQAELRQYPEIIALAFWFRKAHLDKLATEFESQRQSNSPGRVFHIAPANVDTVFLYSVLLSVLSGNQNIVRVSERSGDVSWVLIELLKHYLNTESGKVIKPLISVVQYSAQQIGVTEQFSLWCDLRVVWGGDNAINAISDIAPTTKQVCFPDRYSVALLELDEKSDLQQIAKALLTDVIPFNQQACSSPKAIYWLNTKQSIQTAFWQSVKAELSKMDHQLGLSNKVEQHILLQKLAAAYAIKLDDNSGNKIASFAKIQSIGPIGHCKVKSLTDIMLAEHTGNGLLIELDIGSVDEIAYSDKLQTISYLCSQSELKPNGKYKRLISLGKALEFDSVWDGVDLVKIFSRVNCQN